MRHRKEQQLKRRRAYLREFGQLTMQQQQPHLALIMSKIIDRLNRSKIDQPCGGLSTKQLL